MPRCAESGVARAGEEHAPVGVLGQAGPHLLPVTLQPSSVRVGPAGQRGQVAPGPGFREALAPGLVAAEQPGHHGRGQRRRGVVDHRRRQHLGHGVDAGLHQAPGGQRLAEIGAEQRRPAQAADALGPPPAHQPGVVGEPLDLGQVGHLVVEGVRDRRIGPQVVLVLVEPVVERPAELLEVHQADGAGRVGSCGPPGVPRPALAEERHGPGVQPPALGGAPVGVAVVADAHVVGRLLHEAQRLLAAAGVPVQLERGRAHQEEPLGGGRHQGREVHEPIGVAEGAVGAVGGEDVHHGLDVVLGHAHGVAGQQLLELDHVVDRNVRHHASS